MDRLPAEVLRIIMEELDSKVTSESPDDRLIDIHRFATNANIKSMRLCCRWVGLVAAEFLYREVWLYMEQSSFAKLASIAKHPLYCHMVHELRFFPRFKQHVFFENQAYMDYFGEMEENRERNHIHPFGFDVPKGRCWTQTEINNCSEGYSILCREHAESFSSAEPLFHTAMNAFTNLTAVNFQKLNPLPTLCSGLSVADVARGTDAKNRTKLIQFYGNLKSVPVHDSRDVALAMKGLAQARRMISRLDFFDCTDDIDDLECDVDPIIGYPLTGNLEFVKTVFAQIRHLRVPSGFLHARLLSHCPNLESLCVTSSLCWGSNDEDQDLDAGHYPHPYPSLHRGFGNIHWVNLQALSIVWDDISADLLIAVLRRHRSTLVKVQLWNISLWCGSWFRVLNYLREMSNDRGEGEGGKAPLILEVLGLSYSGQ